MNRETAKILAPIFQAFADGKDIDYMGKLINDPCFLGSPRLYSISKPKSPKDVWLNIDKCKDGSVIGNIYNTKCLAIANTLNWDFTAVHYQRVDY